MLLLSYKLKFDEYVEIIGTDDFIIDYQNDL